MDELLGFYYDQARDALVIHKIIHEQKLTLIGPTTGIEGIFLGPFYYYLLLPAYLIGSGDPAVAASWVGLINSLTIFGIFFIGRKLFNTAAGFIGAFLFAFSWDAIYFARWFANPSPLPFFVCLILLSLINLKQLKKDWWLVILAAGVALSLQIEAAAAIWFIPATLISLIVLKIRPSFKWIIISTSVFLVLSSPLLLFDLKHDFLILKAFQRFLLSERSFQTSFWETLKLRIPFYLNTLASALALDFSKTLFGILATLLTVTITFGRRSSEVQNNKWGLWLLLIWIFTPLFGFLFYQGNHGYVWSYYLSGLIPAFYLVLGFALVFWLSRIYLAPLALVFLFLFLNFNFKITQGYLTQGEPGENGVQFRNQKKAIDFIYKDAKGEDFNLDAYVPPVIPYTYDYLTVWYGKKKYGYQPKLKQIPLLYTLEEIDPPHPERLEAFIKRQDSISKVISKNKFGGITVEKRSRINLIPSTL